MTSTDCLTTVVYDKPPILMSPITSPANFLYFRLGLKFDGARFDGEQRKNLKRCLRAAVEIFGGSAQAVGFDDDEINLLIALPLHKILEDFVARMRIFSKFFARRKLNAPNFIWCREYQVSTVGFAQLEAVSGTIRKRDRLIAVHVPELIALETID